MPMQSMSQDEPKAAKALARFALRLRDKSGLDTREQAAQFGLSTSVWSRLERGYGCGVPTLIRLRKHTRESIDSMLGLETRKRTKR